jgi:FSR family fosmidomycin resistance protein-like MFS transporter
MWILSYLAAAETIWSGASWLTSMNTRSHGKARNGMQRPQPRSLLPVFALGHLCNDFAPCAIWIIAPAVAVAMDLSPAQLGLLFAIHNIGAAIAYLPGGIAADHISDRGRLLVATFWWVGFGYLAASFAPGYWTLALLLAIGGLGDAVWHPVATGTLVQQAPTGRARALGIHAMGGTFAEVLGPLLVGFLLSYMDWRTALRICVVPAFVMGILFIFVARHIPKRPTTRFSHHDLISLWQIWRTPSGLKVVCLIAIYNMALVALLSMTPLYLQRRHGMGPEMTGMTFSAMVLVWALWRSPWSAESRTGWGDDQSSPAATSWPRSPPRSPSLLNRSWLF